MAEQDAFPAPSSTRSVSRGNDKGSSDQSTLTLVPAPERFWNSSAWTRVTSNNRLVHELLQAFFSLDTGYRAVLALSPFLDDMELGRTDYCGASLVNAVLALASISHSGKGAFPSAERRIEHAEAFSQESHRHLTRQANSLADVQAFGVLSVYEVTKGNDRLAIELSHECIQLAQRLGFHGDLPSETASSANTDMQYFCLATFLVCYQIDR